MLDSHLALVWLLAAPAISPLIQPAITRSADGMLHLYRIVALDHAVRQGILFPRWWPDLVYGYGLPLFVFYAPLSYYLTEGLHLLGLTFVAAFNISFALALLVSATGTYYLVKDVFGAGAGVLAGVAYVYAPYQLFNLLSRGSLPIAWAGALFPLTLWAFGRLVRGGGPGYIPASAMLCAAALLAHNISSLVFLPLLCLYLAILLFTRRNQTGQVAMPLALLRVGLALGLGLVLAAFFLVPAIFEKEFIQAQRVITPPDFDYHYNFVNLKQLLSLPRAANTGLLNPEGSFMLGLVQVGLALLGLVGLWTLPGADQRGLIMFALVGLAGILFFTLPISVGVWERLPLMAFIQQPHRLLSLAALLLAILAGAALPASGRWAFGLLLLALPLLFMAAAPLLYPGYYQPSPANLTLTGMMAYERATGAIGTTSFGEYLPVWVEQAPRESPLEPMYEAGETIDRLDRAYLPPEAVVESAAYGFNQAELILDSPEPYPAVFHTFYFPGWQARVDGRPVAVTPVSQRGLVSVSMPAGRHHLHLSFHETPVRFTADMLSSLALIGVALLTVRAWRRKADRRVETGLLPPPARLTTRFSKLQFAALVAVGVGLISFKMLYLDHSDTFLKRSFSGTDSVGADAPSRVNFGHQVTLLGYDLESGTAAPDQRFDLTLYWQARRPLTTNYSALAHLIDGERHLYAGLDNLHPGHLPTIRWQPWGFVQDRHSIRVPPGTPPGSYFLAVGLYDPASWARLPVINGGNNNWGDVVVIPVKVLPPDQPPSLTELGIAWPVTQELSPALRLLGATPERNIIRKNDFLRIALFWEATATPIVDYQVALRLMDTTGDEILSATGRPSHGRYPTTVWQAGERVRDNHALWISPDFPAGSYRVQTQILDAAGNPGSEWIDLGLLTTDP